MSRDSGKDKRPLTPENTDPWPPYGTPDDDAPDTIRVWFAYGSPDGAPVDTGRGRESEDTAQAAQRTENTGQAWVDLTSALSAKHPEDAPDQDRRDKRWRDSMGTGNREDAKGRIAEAKGQHQADRGRRDWGKLAEEAEALKRKSPTELNAMVAKNREDAKRRMEEAKGQFAGYDARMEQARIAANQELGVTRQEASRRARNTNPLAWLGGCSIVFVLGILFCVGIAIAGGVGKNGATPTIAAIVPTPTVAIRATVTMRPTFTPSPTPAVPPPPGRDATNVYAESIRTERDQSGGVCRVTVRITNVNRETLTSIFVRVTFYTAGFSSKPVAYLQHSLTVNVPYNTSREYTWTDTSCDLPPLPDNTVHRATAYSPWFGR